MGLFSKLFGRTKESSKSHVRRWAERRQKELRYPNEFTPENLFAALIYGLGTFAKEKPSRKTPSDLKGLGIDPTEHFGSDATLFEVGCYLYFLLDLWLFQNKPHLRDEISTTFLREFDLLFTEALGINNVSELFNERIGKYGELARAGADMEKYHFYLSQLILRTKDGTPPSTYNFDQEPLNLSLLEDTGIKMELLIWEQSMLPAIIESLKNYYKFVE